MFIRFIYVYRWKKTGAPVYVGSAWNPAKRDKSHSNGDSIPFDRFIAKHGRKSFTLEIVEAFRAATIEEAWKLSAARENHWMDVARTWHAFGGHNYAHATVNFDSKQQYGAWREAIAAAGKKRSQDPAWHKAYTAGREKMKRNPAWQAAQKAANKKLAQNPAWRVAHKAGHEKMKHNPAWRAANKAAGEKMALNPAWRAAQKSGAAKRSVSGQLLPTKQIVKMYQQGCSVPEIARAIGCPPYHGQNRVRDFLIRAGAYRSKKKKAACTDLVTRPD